MRIRLAVVGLLPLATLLASCASSRYTLERPSETRVGYLYENDALPASCELRGKIPRQRWATLTDRVSAARGNAVMLPFGDPENARVYHCNAADVPVPFTGEYPPPA